MATTKRIRKFFLLTIGMLVGSGLYLLPGRLLAAETPQQGIQSFLDSIRAMQFPIVDAASHQKFLARTDAYLDLEAMGKKALGGHWAQMTPDEQKSFMDLLWKLIENIAYPRTKNFLGDQKTSYQEPKPLAKGVEVSSMVKGPGFAQPPARGMKPRAGTAPDTPGKPGASSAVKDQEAALDVPVVYNLYEENGQWKIYDIFMDGISMTEDLRFQFDKIIQETSFPGLLTRMSERLAKAQKETAGK